MTMNDANIKCLLHCSENILQCDVKHVSDFTDITLFFKILNNRPIELDIEHLLLYLSNIFGFNIDDALNLDDKNFLTDFELIKILLLCIVVYILTNNDKGGSKKLNNLCDNIPIDLHKNACMMFAPLIVKFSDKLEITNKDIENALLLNDKENQTNFFSPIRDKNRPYLVNEKKISVHKQKIYRDMKASQSFELFPSEMCSSPETSSPLVKLVEYVQSPSCQERIELRKTNKNLEKNVNQLEHQLFLNSNFESELDKTINVWKQKYKSLEKDVKSMQASIDEKDDLIREKSKEIDELKNVAYQNKKLEDKSKDYQEKVNEIQFLNSQLDDKCEENRILRIENRESSHFKALAIDRRTIIKSLTGQIEQYKLMETQFHETCTLLMKTQSELNELQNHIHSSKLNKNSDSFSEVSLNSSIYHPESLAGIVEMERDELKTELSLLKENCVAKETYDNAIEQINELNRVLNDSRVQCSKLQLEQEAIAAFCQSMANCANPLSDLDIAREFPSSQYLSSFQKIFLQIQITADNQKQNIEHLATANSILTNDINQKVDAEKKHIFEIDSKQKQLEEIEVELSGIKELLVPDEMLDCKDKEFFLQIKQKIISYQQTLEKREEIIRNFKNHYLTNFRILRNEIETAKQIFKNVIQSLSVDFQDFKFLMLSDSSNRHSFSNPFIESLHKLYNLLKANQANQNQLYHNNQELVKSLEKSKRELEKQNKEHEQMKIDLTAKHANEQLEMKTELSKLIFEYQECLASLQDISWKYEEQIVLKNENEKNEKRILELTRQIDELNENLSSSQSKLLSKTQEMSVLKRFVEEIKQINIDYSKEIDNLKSCNAVYKLKSVRHEAEKMEEIKNLETKIDTKLKEIIEKEDKINKLEEKNKMICEELKLKVELEEKIKQKDKEINIKCFELEVVNKEKIKLENDLIRSKNEMDILGKLNSGKHEEIKNLETKIDTKQREIIEKEDKINKLEEKNKMICEELKLKVELEEKIKQKNEEINIKCFELEIVNEEKIKLENDLIRSKNEMDILEKLNSIKITELIELQEKQQMESKESLRKLIEEISNLKLLIEEKEQEISKNNDSIIRLRKLVDETNSKHHDASVEIDYLKIIDEKYVELSKIHQELEWKFEKCVKENIDSICEKNIEIDKMKTEIDRFTKLEKERIGESEEKNAKLSKIQEELISTKSAIECLREKHSKLEEEHILVSNNFNKINNEHYLDIGEKNKNIDELNRRLLELDHSNRLLEHSTECYSEKVVIFEAALTDKIKELNIVNEKFEASMLDIEELKSKLEYQIDSQHLKEMQIESLQIKLDQFEKEKIDLESSIVDLNSEIAEVMKSNELKQIAIDNVNKESETKIHSLQETISNLSSELEVLQAKLKSIAKEKEAKSLELNAANMSLVDFHSKIQNLEAIINEEMHNYEKVTEEYKQVERESNCYREKYNNLIKLKRDESLSYESQLKKLTEHINKMEEEHDNQIHEMEKSYNTKIFDLQQNLDDKSLELDSIKSEIIENRKLSKLARVNLESEKDRLQKAITTRETQFTEEKSQLITNMEKERQEKLKYKEHYEGIICKLENDMKNADELNKKEYDELKIEYNKLMEQLKASQLGHSRLVEESKQNELEYQKEKEALITRFEELEPLESKIDELESTTDRLLKKLNALEKSASAKELKSLKSEIMTSKEAITILEKEKRELISKLISLENKVKNQIQHINEVTVGRNEYKNRLSNLQDQIYNFESLDKTRLMKIENIEREIESIKSENVSLKSRYLKLREISETHLEKVNRSHEETVNNYIERIGSLTRDVANFQEQVQLLTAEKNMFKDDNNALKRSLSEVTSQFDNLKTVLQEHTANEVRAMNAKYNENNRYTRMSHWDARPQISRYLPPINSLDTDSVSHLNLNPKSKLRFESYVFNPYACEDESDISLVRDFPQRMPVCDKKHIKSDGNLSQISSSTKKKKEGIRHQIVNKIRRSLHMDSGSSELKFPEKNTNHEMCPTSTSSVKSESIASVVKVSSKPPVLLRKKYAKSSQFNVIDLDELRNRKEKNILKSPVKSKTLKQENVFSVSNTPTLTATSSTSVNSLFDKNRGTNDDLLENSPRQVYKVSEAGLRNSPYTQRAKTPKPNSVIRRLIRKSKTKTPISKCNSINKMF